MARIKFPDITPLNKFVQENPGPVIEDLVMIEGMAFRAKIISDRYDRGFERADIQGPVNAFETSGLSIFETEKLDRRKKLRLARHDRVQAIQSVEGSYTFEPAKDLYVNPSDALIDTITIIDYDFGSDRGRRGYSSLTLPFVPRDLSYQPSSKFVGIATMGRNNPHYHFTGSEDTLTFDIDWFSSQPDRKDVINNCRWVEALSKADSYTEAPHRVQLVWGQQDLLFANSKWIVVEAPYTLSDFVKGYRDRDSKEVIKVGMLPQQAYQRVTLKRITNNNLTSHEIITGRELTNL